jgi:hypothetical protein
MLGEILTMLQLRHNILWMRNSIAAQYRPQSALARAIASTFEIVPRKHPAHDWWLNVSGGVRNPDDSATLKSCSVMTETEQRAWSDKLAKKVGLTGSYANWREAKPIPMVLANLTSLKNRPPRGARSNAGVTTTMLQLRVDVLPNRCKHGLTLGCCAVCKEQNNVDYLTARQQQTIVMGPWSVFIWPPSEPLIFNLARALSALETPTIAHCGVVEHKTFGPGTALYRKITDSGTLVVVVQYGDIERTLVIDSDHWITSLATILKMKEAKPVSFFVGDPSRNFAFWEQAKAIQSENIAQQSLAKYAARAEKTTSMRQERARYANNHTYENITYGKREMTACFSAQVVKEILNGLGKN